MNPNVDTFTTWVKLIVQLILLLTALLQAHSIWLERRKKNETFITPEKQGLTLEYRDQITIRTVTKCPKIFTRNRTLTP